MFKKLILYALLLFFQFPFLRGMAQVKKGEVKVFTDIYDSAYGINAYDALNMGTGGDSTRHDAKGYATQGWIEDTYADGKVAHKGYYIDGQLKAYKNYFPSGQLEREYRMIDLKKSNMIVYYENGKIRSNIVYQGSNIIKEEDYYESGQLEYIEEYDGKGECYVQRKFFHPNGKPSSTLELTDTKKKIYVSKEYHDNGNLKEEGTMIYSKAMGDYQKHGKWKYYDENGQLKEEKTFSKGDEGSD